MAYSITKKEVPPQPVLLMRRRVKRSEIASALAQMLPNAFQYAQWIGAVMVGPPFTRYLDWGPGLIAIEAGVPVAASAPGEGDIVADTLPGGLVANTTHAAVQVWIEEQGLVAAGAPWEFYVTDPASYPDPKD